MTDNTPKPMTAEELQNQSDRINNDPDNFSERTIFDRVALYDCAAALVAAIDRNTEALKELKLIVQHPTTVIEREREGDLQ